MLLAKLMLLAIGVHFVPGPPPACPGVWAQSRSQQVPVQTEQLTALTRGFSAAGSHGLLMSIVPCPPLYWMECAIQ